MNFEEFYAERSGRWGELEHLVQRAGRAPRRLPPDDIRRLGALHRSITADLAVARRRFAGQAVIGRLEQLAGTSRSAVYAYEGKGAGAWAFLTTGYWRRIRERPVLLLAAFLLLFGPWVLASMWAINDPGAASGLAPSGVESVIERESADFGLSADEKIEAAAEIFTNNIWVAILAFVGGIAAAIGAALVLVYNGIVLGATFGLTIEAGNSDVLWEFVIPHGILEMSCTIVAGVAGMRMGWALVNPGTRTRLAALQAEARPAAEIIVGTAIVLVFSGIIEGVVSTSGIGVGPGLVIGISLGALFWGAVLWRGRPESAELRPTRPVPFEASARPATV